MDKITIIKDAIEQIKAGKFIPVNGRFCVVENLSLADSKAQLQDVIKKNKCEACALGSLFLSKIHLYNDLSVENSLFSLRNENPYYSQDSVEPELWYQLVDIFGEDQLNLIEMAFEGQVYDILTVDYDDDTTIEMNEDCLTFFENHPNRNTRLLAIFENMLSNNGFFVP